MNRSDNKGLALIAGIAIVIVTSIVIGLLGISLAVVEYSKSLTHVEGKHHVE